MAAGYQPDPGAGCLRVGQGTRPVQNASWAWAAGLCRRNCRLASNWLRSPGKSVLQGSRLADHAGNSASAGSSYDLAGRQAAHAGQRHVPVRSCFSNSGAQAFKPAQQSRGSFMPPAPSLSNTVGQRWPRPGSSPSRLAPAGKRAVQIKQRPVRLACTEGTPVSTFLGGPGCRVQTPSPGALSRSMLCKVASGGSGKSRFRLISAPLIAVPLPGSWLSAACRYALLIQKRKTPGSGPRHGHKPAQRGTSA